MTDDVELRRLAIRRADMKLAFRSHLMAYVVVNAGLVAINLITSQTEGRTCPEATRLHFARGRPRRPETARNPLHPPTAMTAYPLLPPRPTINARRVPVGSRKGPS